MKKRKLGNSGREVSIIGLGCMGMDHAYGPSSNRQDMIKLIQRAVELGCDFFDTAVVYGYSNEELLGDALKAYKGKVVIATKFGITGTEQKEGRLVHVLDSSAESIRKQLEGSLKRLKVDCIDLYYQHRVDPKVEPEIVDGVMKELISEGKIKYY